MNEQTPAEAEKKDCPACCAENYIWDSHDKTQIFLLAVTCAALIGIWVQVYRIAETLAILNNNAVDALALVMGR